MLTKINSFFQNLLEDKGETQDSISLEIACAVLLCEVMKADGNLDQQEQNKLNNLLKSQFNISAEEVDVIVEKALYLSEHATDFYQFTSKLNQQYNIEQRVKIVELLWQLAYADDELASIEEHIIRKIADLLHLRHNEYIRTKTHAKNST